MEQYIYDESNGLWYERDGDYYIPCLKEIFGVTGKKTLPVIAIFKKIENYFQKLILNPDFAVAFRPADCRNRPFSVVSDGSLSSAAH